MYYIIIELYYKQFLIGLCLFLLKIKFEKESMSTGLEPGTYQVTVTNEGRNEGRKEASRSTLRVDPPVLDTCGDNDLYNDLYDTIE